MKLFRGYDWRNDAEWKPWFAWYPVRVRADDHPYIGGHWVWLEWVERFKFGDWAYAPRGWGAREPLH